MRPECLYRKRKNQVASDFCEQEKQNQPITARLLQEKFFGQDKEPEEVRTLIGTIREHNNQCRALVGKDYALITRPSL